MRTLKAAWALVVALSLAVPASALAQRSLEDRIKAAIVSKFPQFVEWPPAALTGRTTIDLCVSSADPIRSELEDLTSGETLAGRPLAVRMVHADQDVEGCHVLFIRAAAVPSSRALLQRARALPVLTVSDDPRFLDEGGIVRLRQVDGRLRFDVDAATAERAGLRISSQLLQLAVTVRGGPA